MEATRRETEVAQEALCLTPAEWETLEGICNHYLLATGWAEGNRLVPGKAVLARRELAKRIVEASTHPGGERE